MSVLPSLIAALERAAGDCLVLRAGERPHVVAGETRHDVGTTTLSVKAVEALAAQILSPEGQRELAERSCVQEVLGVALAEGSLTARAERAGDEMYVELRRHRRPLKPAKVEEPAPAAVVEPANVAAPAPVVTPEAPPVEDPTPVAVAEPASVEPPAHVAVSEPVAGLAPVPVAVQPPTIEPSNQQGRITESDEASAPTKADGAGEPAPQFIVERFEPVAEGVAPPPPQVERFEPAAEAVAAPPPRQVEREPIEPMNAPPIAPMDVATPPEAVAPPVSVSAPAPTPVAAPALRAPAVVPPPAASDFSDDLDELIADAAERGATALYLRAGQRPSARIDERLQVLDDGVVSASTMSRIIASCTGGADGWIAGVDGEWIREFDLAGTVRCHPFADQAGGGVVIHLAPRSSATGLLRHVPRQIRRACEAEDGLVVVAAPSQADLLAMVAAVADLAASKRAGYVICLEPPTGLPHPVTGAFVSQRTLAGSAEDVSATIRRAVQEMPDILVVGVTESAAAVEEVILSATAAGRLVILGAVAPTALLAVESLLAGVDREREPHVRKTLAAALRAAFSYRGLRRPGGGRTAVQDVVVGTRDVRVMIERADFGGIEQAQRHGDDGMRTLDAALARAVARRLVSLRQAAAHATNKADFVALTRRSARERRALLRGHRPDWRQGVLRAI